MIETEEGETERGVIEVEEIVRSETRIAGDRMERSYPLFNTAIFNHVNCLADFAKNFTISDPTQNKVIEDDFVKTELHMY